MDYFSHYYSTFLEKYEKTFRRVIMYLRFNLNETLVIRVCVWDRGGGQEKEKVSVFLIIQLLCNILHKQYWSSFNFHQFLRLCSALPKIREDQSRPKRTPTWYMTRQFSEMQNPLRDGSDESSPTFSGQPKLSYEHVNENDEDDTSNHVLHHPSTLRYNSSSYQFCSPQQSHSKDLPSDPVNSFINQIFDQNSDNENIFSI